MLEVSGNRSPTRTSRSSTTLAVAWATRGLIARRSHSRSKPGRLLLGGPPLPPTTPLARSGGPCRTLLLCIPLPTPSALRLLPPLPLVRHGVPIYLPCLLLRIFCRRPSLHLESLFAAPPLPRPLLLPCVRTSRGRLPQIVQTPPCWPRLMLWGLLSFTAVAQSLTLLTLERAPHGLPLPWAPTGCLPQLLPWSTRRPLLQLFLRPLLYSLRLLPCRLSRVLLLLHWSTL